MTLPSDICRCHDDGCHEREQCRRWLERESGTTHAASLFPYDLALSEPCPMRLPLADAAGGDQ